MSAVYYFGRWGGPGHYLWSPAGHIAEQAVTTPWTLRELDPLCGDPALADVRGRRSGDPLYWPGDEAHQPQGVARLYHREGWTALAWWDRSCDTRFGSNSAFVARGTLTAEALAQLGATAFPSVWTRVEAAGGLVLP